MTAGIVCDDYKVEEYKKQLKKQGFNDFTVTKNYGAKLGGTHTIKVECEKDDVQKLALLCKTAEINFKNSN